MAAPRSSRGATQVIQAGASSGEGRPISHQTGTGGVAGGGGEDMAKPPCSCCGAISLNQSVAMASDIRRRTDHASVARIVDALRSISHPALARVIQECDTL